MLSFFGLFPQKALDPLGFDIASGVVHPAGTCSGTGHVDHQCDADDVRHKVRTAIGQKRQRDAGDGHQPQAHGNVFEHVEKQHSRDPDDQQPAVAVLGLPGQEHHPGDDEED